MGSDVTRVLDAAARGDPGAADRLLPLVYAELRRLAAQKLAREQPGQTLDATALVHEAYLRLVGNPKHEIRNPKKAISDFGIGPSELPRFEGRGHFFAAAAEAMRRILVERARYKRRYKHGGQLHRVDLPDLPADSDPEADRLLALDDALNRLASEDAVAAKVVELRHFAGLGHEATADALGMSIYQARQKWTFARAWLRDALDG